MNIAFGAIGGVPFCYLPKDCPPYLLRTSMGTITPSDMTDIITDYGPCYSCSKALLAFAILCFIAQLATLALVCLKQFVTLLKVPPLNCVSHLLIDIRIIVF